MKLLEMSISAGVLITLLTLIRLMGLSKLPKRMFALLWIVVLIRLILPFSIPMKNGIATPVLYLLQNRLHILWNYLGIHIQAATNPMPGAASSVISGNTEQNMFLSGNVLLAVHGVWIAGVAGLGIYFVYSYIKEYRMQAQAIPLQQEELETGRKLAESFDTARRLAGLRQNHKKRSQLFIYDRIQSPFVWGITRQRIVFPKNLQYMEQSKIQYMLTHEMIHIKRRDNLWKFLSAAVVCIHWFNPMVWLMYFMLARDLELSCDEQVLALYGSKSREEYAMTLLELAQNQNGRTLFCSGFEKNLTKERIVAIMKYKNLTRTSIFSAAVLLAGAVTVFASNDKAAASEEEIKAQGNIAAAVDSKDTDRSDTSASESAVEDQKDNLVSYTIVESTGKEKDWKQDTSKKDGIDKNTDSILVYVDDKIDGEISSKKIGETDYYYIEEDWDKDESASAEKSSDASSIVWVGAEKYAIKNIEFVKGEDNH